MKTTREGARKYWPARERKRGTKRRESVTELDGGHFLVTLQEAGREKDNINGRE